MSIFGGRVQDECFITEFGSSGVNIDSAAEPSPNISTLPLSIESLRTRHRDRSCKIQSSCASLAAANMRGLANAHRHITISITAPPGTVEQDLLVIDVGPDMTIADLKAVVQSDTNVPTSTQAIYHNGRELRDERQTLEQCQVKQDDMLEMLVRGPQSHAAQAQRPGQGEASASAQDAPGQRGRPPTTGMDAEIVRLQALGDADSLAQLRTQAPLLADAVSDPIRFHQAWETMQQQAQEREDAKQREYALLNEDEFNVEAQAKIEEMIREQQVAENLQNALDYNPEGRFTLIPNLQCLHVVANLVILLAFGRVHMLYIDVEVNNNRVKAFVDSGAQATIMSPDCAEKCGIMRLIDKRYAGVARGVGTAKILGRVHAAQIKIGDLFLACSFTVMEGKEVDLLLGLDMLKRHQASIDLRKGKLVIGEVEVPFLGEADIPQHQASEPTVQGPSGMKTGAISGAVISEPEPSSDNFKGKGQTVGGSTADSAILASSAQPSSTAASSRFPENDIAQLISMGFSREQAIQGLELANGNVELAAGVLFD
ncbi:MAG: DNA damage-inducible protein 1 [Heterodermia speciosa]|uniref:DNA damage-inducible protein 1 n=1 Tax=Heterodermia speciosa TaxID=116794 RepID=A0A8H3IHA8_9LECA|nr:MAG: DNA damage-inducible protein 1 [Heterodermia speciosa]